MTRKSSRVSTVFSRSRSSPTPMELDDDSSSRDSPNPNPVPSSSEEEATKSVSNNSSSKDSEGNAESGKDTSDSTDEVSEEVVSKKKVQNPKPSAKNVRVSLPKLPAKFDLADNVVVDIEYMVKKGLRIDEFLGNVNCKKLCELHVVVFGEILFEFYKNLDFKKKDRWSTSVCNQKVVITRKDIIDFLGLDDCDDDAVMNKMSKKTLFTKLNDGFKTDVDRDVFVLQFPLIVRILHKIVCACILPKKGSKTSISIDEGKIIFGMLKGKKVDVAGKILQHSFNNRDRRPYGSLIMNLLKKKKVKIPEKPFRNFPVKRFDKSNLHHMGIHVRKNVWISNDLCCVL